MAGFNNVRAIIDTEEADGKCRFYTFRKSPVQITAGGIWFDLSMSPGNPVPNYYAATPLTSIALKQSTDGGIFHGGNVSPSCKYIKNFGIMSGSATPLPMTVIVQDYLLYYPFLDDGFGAGDPQLLTNSVSLPRYTDGEGVQIMAVTVAARTGGTTFTCSYTNQDGVSGRTTGLAGQNLSTIVGTITNTGTASAGGVVLGPYLTLQQGDTGVRSVESVTLNGSDVGLMTIVLVKPLMQVQIREQTAMVETQPFLHKGCAMPEIQDDAYINMICLPSGSVATSNINGYLETIWV